MGKLLNKETDQLKNCGESWEISGVKGDISTVSEGRLKGQSLNHLIDTYGDRLMGQTVMEKFGKEFPLLVKYIDADDDLSIQVHPDDQTALERHDSYGKTEMWYVLEAEEGASLFCGFKRKVDEGEFERLCTGKEILEVLNEEPVEQGDVFFLPSGRVHSIGKGIVLAEIQQTSDITYRIYDFDRLGVDGKKRDLHIQEAVNVIDYEPKSHYKTKYDKQWDKFVNLVSCSYFTTNYLEAENPVQRELSMVDSFKIYMCLRGEAILTTADEQYSLRTGDTILVPAELKSYTIEPSGYVKIIESYVSP